MIEIQKITVVDACMGRGKSSAAIRYMNDHKGEKCFLYITPYLAEVDRVCELCDFDEPGCDYRCKSIALKAMLQRRKNIASTHSLFSIMDDEALEIVKQQGYTLIIDESIPVINGVLVTNKDKEMLLENCISVGDNGRVEWIDETYEGKFEGYMEMAKHGDLYYYAGSFFELMPTNRFSSFDKVFMLTYMFDGQIQKAYMDFFDMEYEIVGVECDERGFFFSDRPDEPPPVDYAKLIHIVNRGKILDVGDQRTALSASWFKSRSANDPDIRKLKNNLRNFLDRMTADVPGSCLWTTFKEHKEWLYGPKKRYSEKYLSLNARATNAYRDATRVAYLANRFIDPNYIKFFSQKDICISHDQFALSEMLQFIWRSAIRDGKEIHVYIPSHRMRWLLTQWIHKDQKKGKKR